MLANNLSNVEGLERYSEKYVFVRGGVRYELDYSYSTQDPLQPEIKNLEFVQLSNGFGRDDLTIFRNQPPYPLRLFESLDIKTQEIINSLPDYIRKVVKKI